LGVMPFLEKILLAKNNLFPVFSLLKTEMEIFG